MKRITFDFKSIKFKLWLYFAILTFVIVGLIWLLQTVFLNNSYEKMKIEEVMKIGQQLAYSFNNADENFTQKVQELSVVNDMYVMMESNETILVFSPDQESIAPVYKYKTELPQLKKLLDDPRNHSNVVSYKFSTSYEKYNTLAYAHKVSGPDSLDAVLYLFSPLYPVSSTIQILKSQLLTVTLISILLAFLLAMFFSSRLSQPIKEMTQSANKLGSGDYSVKFDSNSSYTEVNELADTLNMTAYELLKQDERQKDLIANVSHDLKTPLTMIRSYAEMIRDLSGDNPEKRNKHLQVIMSESDRMTNLVSDMSQITALQSHKIQLEKSYFDLGELTASILSSYEIYQDQQGYDFVLNIPKEAPVYADENRIKQVLNNLISNAVKYCGEDKVVMVNVKRVGRKFRVDISDHGPGISQEDIPHIWDRYYKTSQNYARPTEGTGLGLSIVKEILTLHHSSYGVISKLGKGTSFWFELDMIKERN